MFDDVVLVYMPRELAEWWAGYDLEEVSPDRLMLHTRNACREALPDAPIRPRSAKPNR